MRVHPPFPCQPREGTCTPVLAWPPQAPSPGACHARATLCTLGPTTAPCAQGGPRRLGGNAGTKQKDFPKNPPPGSLQPEPTALLTLNPKGQQVPIRAPHLCPLTWAVGGRGREVASRWVQPFPPSSAAAKYSPGGSAGSSASRVGSRHLPGCAARVAVGHETAWGAPCSWVWGDGAPGILLPGVWVTVPLGSRHDGCLGRGIVVPLGSRCSWDDECLGMGSGCPWDHGCLAMGSQSCWCHGAQGMGLQ